MSARSKNCVVGSVFVDTVLGKVTVRGYNTGNSVLIEIASLLQKGDFIGGQLRSRVYTNRQRNNLVTSIELSKEGASLLLDVLIKMRESGFLDPVK